MSIPIRKKTPDEVLDFGHTFATTLGESDTIASSAWTVTDDLVIDSDSSTDTTTTVWVSGGTLNTGYDLVNTVVTALGRTISRAIRIICVQR